MTENEIKVFSKIIKLTTKDEAKNITEDEKNIITKFIVKVNMEWLYDGKDKYKKPSDAMRSIVENDKEYIDLLKEENKDLLEELCRQYDELIYIRSENASEDKIREIIAKSKNINYLINTAKDRVYLLDNDKGDAYLLKGKTREAVLKKLKENAVLSKLLEKTSIITFWGGTMNEYIKNKMDYIKSKVEYLIGRANDEETLNYIIDILIDLSIATAKRGGNLWYMTRAKT